MKKLTKGEKISRVLRGKYGPDYWSRIGKKGAEKSVLTGIKNGTLKVVPVK